MPAIKCPACGKVVSIRFPIHNCVIPIEPPKFKKVSGEKLPQVLREKG